MGKQKKNQLTATGHLAALIAAVQEGTHAFANIGNMIGEDDQPIDGKCGLLYVPYSGATLTFSIQWYDNTLTVFSLQEVNAHWTFRKVNGIWSGIQAVVEKNYEIRASDIYSSVVKPIYNTLK